MCSRRDHEGKTMYKQSAHLRRALTQPVEGSLRVKSSLLRRSALLLRLGVVGLLVSIGLIHLHLWLEGYRFIPTNGPLFLVDAIAGFVLAAALAAWPRILVGLAAAGFAASTLGALLISLSVGLFGFKESIGASYVVLSIVLEAIAGAGALVWTVLVLAAFTGRAEGAPTNPVGPGAASQSTRGKVTGPDFLR